MDVETYYERNKKNSLEYYYKNKATILAKRKEIKIECSCGSVVRKADLSIHLLTKKHLEFVCKK